MITIREAEEILKKEYHIDNYTYMVDELILPDFKADKHEVVFNNSIFASVNQLGYSVKCDVTVYEVLLNDGAQNRRVAITQEMFRVLRGQGINNAIVAFANADKRNYRLSLLTSKYEFDGNKVVKVLSNPRRYSYSLGYGTKTKTAYDFLISKGKVHSLDELIGRFSIEIVNKHFYNEIALSFTKLIGGKRESTNFEKELNLHSVTNQNKYAEFAVRLIGRIVFCWFLKEKKSEAGIPLVPDNMLSIDAIKNSTNYYHDVLEPLFFELLNTNQNRRKNKFINDEYYKQIPYLNGGLFSPHVDDRYKFDMATGGGQYGVVTIENDWFVHFIEILSQYNFTVDENTSYDIELSIDPEMLGRIFENLLAEINPETGENAKKSTGSFYTPRDIVDYMVDNSILVYLKTKTGLEETRLKALISYSKEDDDIASFTNAEKKAIISALYTVTVLDPACGSGAFPIGMLQKIVYMLQEIDPEADLWFDEIVKGAPIYVRKAFEEKFSNGELDYIRKLTVIEKSIYGVDIQPIAVEIARLRCFLSLVIEQKVNDTLPNRGVHPLPSLDFKFLIANSLVKLPDDTSSNFIGKVDQLNIFENVSHIDELKAVREEYFNADNERKAELREEFADIQKRMFQQTLSMAKNASPRYSALSNWSPFKNEPTDWFDAEWMFGVKDGFDIVIGNPPYIKIQNINNEQAEYYKHNFTSANGKFDIYVLFDEKAFYLLKDDGITAFIQPHRFILANYGKALRKFILKYRFLNRFVNFGVEQVFDTATTYTGIFFFKKKSDNIKFAYAKEANLQNCKFYVKEYEKLGEQWTFGEGINQQIIDKIQENKIKVLDVFDGIYQGAITVGDDIFVLQGMCKDNLFYGYSEALGKDVVLEKEIVQPLLKGENIRRYLSPASNIYLIYPHKLENGKTIPYKESEIKKQFPLFYEYIKNFEDDLRDKKIKYKTNPEYWFSLHRAREKYLFEQVKIITPQLQNYPNFTIDDKNFYPDAGGYMLVSSRDIMSLYPYYAILNSSLFWFFIKSTSTPFSSNYYYFKTAYIEPFKFPELSENDKKFLIDNVREIITCKEKQADSTKAERAIDKFVYNLYNLNSEEIALVEESVK